MKALNIEKNEKGFTRIELMIVVAIIGTLSSIAVPKFLSYRNKAYDTVARADLQNSMKTRLPPPPWGWFTKPGLMTEDT